MLKPLTTNYKVKNIFGFDIETYSDENKFLMGSIYGEYKDEKTKQIRIFDKVYWNKYEMCNELINKRIFYNNAYVSATNLTFDFLSLFAETNIFPYFKLTIRGSNIITIKYKHPIRKKSTSRYVDSLNYHKLSVKQMGDIIGLSKLPQPICFKRKPLDRTEKIEMENYNKRDTRITFEYMKFLQKGFNELYGTMKTTIAATSMDIFKRNHLDRILIQSKEYLKKIYEGYYGARVEVLKRGYVSDLKYYDFNSLYPSVMLNDYPIPNYEQYKKQGYMSIIRNPEYEGLVYAKVKIEKIDLPYLPYRLYQKKKDGSINKKLYKLIFPMGEFSGWYTFYEIKKAISYGYEILELGEMIYYTKKYKPFTSYVKTIYEKRMIYKKQNNPLEQVSKLNLNSLYGKFGQKYDNMEKIYNIHSLSEKELSNYMNNTEKYKTIIRGDFLYVTEKQVSYVPTFVMPIFAIMTTAYGRTKLYEKIREVGVDNVYYYDTDSIITDKILNTSDKLGDLKLEYILRDGLIVAPKMYAFVTDSGELIKIKGVPKIKRMEDFVKLLATKKVKYEKFVKFKEANARGLQYNQILQVEKQLTLQDNKRNWDNDFNCMEKQDSKPIYIYE